MNADGNFDVLFVDDEQRILDGLRRQLHGRRQAWTMRFAASGADALQMLTERPADVVVTDMRMPGMDGGALLQEVMRLHPQTTRIMLSGQTEQTDLIQDISCIHQYLQKPCQPAALTAAIERTYRLARAVRNPSLRRAAAKIASLPPASSNHRQLLQLLEQDDVRIAEIARVIEQDPALTAKLLQLVSSAFFGLPRRIDNVHDAVVLLGLQTVRSLSTASRLFECMKNNDDEALVSALWRASVDIGIRAETLARQARATPTTQHMARLAGTLSLIGRAILATSSHEAFLGACQRAYTERRSLSAVEIDVFGASQEDVGAYALGI
jgi:CheY-like chemotaxis protein